MLGKVADGGAGLTIAVIDLGFGQNLARLQTLGEIPPPGQVETLSFDAANGLAGRNAYGNRTNHGEIVTQTVFDYAPKARYLLVNYHTEADFIAATDALIARRPDIVVHSNSFIEGPVRRHRPDGARGQPRGRRRDPLVQLGGQLRAAALERRVGRRGRRRRPGLAERRQLDVPAIPGQPITFALSWTSPPGGPPTDLDLSLERREADVSWTPVAASADRQSAGLPTAERITGYAPPAAAEYRVRVVRVSGPPPAGPLTLFSREIPLAAIGGLPESTSRRRVMRRGRSRSGGQLARQRPQVVLVAGPHGRRPAEAGPGGADRHADHGARGRPCDRRDVQRGAQRGGRGGGGAGGGAPGGAGAERGGGPPTLDAMALDLGAPGRTRCSGSAGCG